MMNWRAAGLIPAIAMMAVSGPIAGAQAAGTVTYRGEWNETTVYHTNDLVRFYSTLAIALADNNGKRPETSNSTWQILSTAGTTFSGEWREGDDYREDVIVIYKGQSYYSLVSPNKGNTPGQSRFYWAPFSTPNAIKWGDTAPSNLTGTTGDFWIDTKSMYLYGPKNGSTWPSGISMTGPKGETGDAGATGPAGPTGPKGDKGDTGGQGVPGPAGQQGNPGPQGAQGQRGPSGVQGDPGFQLRVLDLQSKEVGKLVGRDVFISTPKDGVVKLGDVSVASYTGPTSYYFVTPDCTGTKYWEYSALPPPARVMDKDGKPFDAQGKALFAGYLTYAKEPFAELTYASASFNGVCTPTSGSAMLGEVGAMLVTWKAPLRIVK